MGSGCFLVAAGVATYAFWPNTAWFKLAPAKVFVVAGLNIGSLGVTGALVAVEAVGAVDAVVEVGAVGFDVVFSADGSFFSSSFFAPLSFFGITRTSTSLSDPKAASKSSKNAPSSSG